MDREITIRVPDEVARRIDEQVASGDYASVEEAAEAAVVSAYRYPTWLTNDAIRTGIAEADADPRPSVPLEEAFDEVLRYIDTLTERSDEKTAG